MKPNRWMPRKPHFWLSATAAGLAALVAMLYLAGIRGLDWHHASARLNIGGLVPDSGEALLEAKMMEIAGYRRGRVGLIEISAADRWRMELEFEAGSITEAVVRLEEWRRQFHPPVRITIEQIRYQPLRIHRPGRGDLVFGPPQTLSGSELSPGADRRIRTDRRVEQLAEVTR